MRAGWFLDSVQILVPVHGKNYMFPSHRWLDEDEADGKTTVELYPSEILDVEQCRQHIKHRKKNTNKQYLNEWVSQKSNRESPSPTKVNNGVFSFNQSQQIAAPPWGWFYWKFLPSHHHQVQAHRGLSLCWVILKYFLDCRVWGLQYKVPWDKSYCEFPLFKNNYTELNYYVRRFKYMS